MPSLTHDLDGVEFPEIKMGLPVLYFDYDRIPHAAIITWVFHINSEFIDRPFCNLATWAHIGRNQFRKAAAPARYDDQIGKWKLTGTWAFVNEVPENEYILPLYNFNGNQIDHTGKVVVPEHLCQYVR